jgi:hypothetical protein
MLSPNQIHPHSYLPVLLDIHPRNESSQCAKIDISVQPVLVCGLETLENSVTPDCWRLNGGLAARCAVLFFGGAKQLS